MFIMDVKCRVVCYMVMIIREGNSFVNKSNQSDHKMCVNKIFAKLWRSVKFEYLYLNFL
jgi:hypothetical protein